MEAVSGEAFDFAVFDARAVFLAAAAMSGKDSMVVSVSGNEERILLTSVFDNLGKGASGAAIENMNIVLGLEPSFGLRP